MQNKGVIRLFAILLSLACAYYLMFTWVANRIMNDANAYSQSYIETAQVQDAAKKVSSNPTEQKPYLDSVRSAKKNFYLDSIKKKPVYNMFIFKLRLCFYSPTFFHTPILKM